jgi:peptidoglycan/xylan/chitin deacetylase (PgdA/CDA1 family)
MQLRAIEVRPRLLEILRCRWQDFQMGDRAFRPKAGHRSVTMLMGAGRAGYTVVGWGWMLWDVNVFRERTADGLVPRLVSRASPGDIVVIHDGDDDNPRADRRYAVETVDRVIPELKTRGFQFGTICP